MTTADPQHVRTGQLARGRRNFRRWRRARPFWGGLLTALAGLEIFGSTQMSLGGFSFQMGPPGYLSWLIPTILVTCAALIWFTPQQRMFYAIVGTMTAVYALIAVNLGGFVIGMLLGMIGGALAFAWTPAPKAIRRTGDAPDAEVPEQPPAPAPAEHANIDDLFAEPPPAPDDPSRRLLAITVVLLSLSAVALTAVEGGTAAHAAPCRPTASPTRSATAPAPAEPSVVPEPSPPPAESGNGNLLAELVDGVHDLATGTGSEPAVATSVTPDPAPSTTAPSPTPSPTPSGGNPAEPEPCETDKPAAPADPDVDWPEIDPEPGQPRVNRVPSRLTGSKLTMYGLRIAGAVDLPTADGTIRALKFSMDKAITNDFVLRVPGRNDQAQLIKSGALTVDGDVDFYATRFVGWLLGRKVTLTPAGPMPPDIPLAVPSIVFDNPEIQLVYVRCGTLSAPNLHQSGA